MSPRRHRAGWIAQLPTATATCQVALWEVWAFASCSHLLLIWACCHASGSHWLELAKTRRQHTLMRSTAVRQRGSTRSTTAAEIDSSQARSHPGPGSPDPMRTPVRVAGLAPSKLARCLRCGAVRLPLLATVVEDVE